MSSPTRLVLIRHGESRAQDEGFVSGHDTCTGLSSLGQRQARALGARLARTGELRDASAVYTSNLLRAQETAAAILSSVGDGSLTPAADCELCEIRPGSYEGRKWDEIATLSPRRCWFRPAWEGAETWAAFTARVGAMLLDIAARHADSTVVVVAHGGVVESSFALFGAVPLVRPFDMSTANTSMTEWTLPAGVDPSAWPPPRWRLVRYNDAAHLADLD